jgi:hypothetical protein
MEERKNKTKPPDAVFHLAVSSLDNLNRGVSLKQLPLSPIAPSDSAPVPMIRSVAPLIHGPTNAPPTGGDGEGRIAGYGRVLFFAAMGCSGLALTGTAPI